MLKRLAAPFLALACATAGWSGSAQSQTVNVQIGGSDRDVIRFLRANGFTQPRVVGRKLTIIRAEACRGNDRLLVKVSILGKITSTTKIGSCGQPAQPTQNATTRTITEEDAAALMVAQGFTSPYTIPATNAIYGTACRGLEKHEFNISLQGKIVFSRVIGKCPERGLREEQITKILTTDGYTRVVITDSELPRYVAEGCRNGDRIRVTMNRRGRIRSERRIGDCGRQFNPANLAQMLEDNGYERVQPVQTRRPPYIAEACKGAERVEVSVGRFGRIRDENRIGTCRVPVDPANLAGLLKDEGYDRVRPLRTNRAPYLVEACKGTDLVELRIGRFGRIRNQDRVGRCAPPVTLADLKKKLVEQGFMNVSVVQSNNIYVAKLCQDENQIELRVDAYGDITRERKIGTCKSQTAIDVLKTLEARGAEEVSISVEGCFKGRKYRWLFDRLGNRTGRERIGSCS